MHKPVDLVTKQYHYYKFGKIGFSFICFVLFFFLLRI